MKKRLSFVAWSLGLGLAIGAVIFWPKHPADRPECPHNWDSTRTNHFLISGAITNVPEYHDCQRFLVKDGKGGLKYDSLEAIFVRDKAKTIYGIHGDSLEPDTLGAIPLSSAFNPNGLVVVGQVVSEGDYAPLGIKIKNNCLVLRWKTESMGTIYEAYMVPVGDDGDRCKDVAPSNLIAGMKPNLEVAFIHAAGVVPPVTRWDWDPIDSLQYIGIVCPTGWCEVHTPGKFHSSPLHGDINDPITKGWYDEQYLATYASGTIVHDGTTFGTVFPDPELARQTMKTYTSWQPVAWVALRSASHAYRDKHNFDPASPPQVPLTGLAKSENSGRLNEVELCFAPSGTTGCRAVGEPPLPKNCTSDNTNNGTWYARETPPNVVKRDPRVTCTEFRSYPGKQAPAVVRWRWQKDDETMWISCPAGCCEVKVKQ